MQQAKNNGNNTSKSGNVQSREDIIAGAHKEDQLDKLSEGITEEDSKAAQQNGTPPGTGDEHLEAAKNTDRLPAEKDDTETEQETMEEKSGDINDLGGASNLSVDQLKAESDNNSSI